MSLYFRGWAGNFLGWGTAPPATVTSSSAGGGMGPLLPPRGIYQIPVPRPQLPSARKPRDDDEDAVLIHLLQ